MASETLFYVCLIAWAIVWLVMVFLVVALQPKGRPMRPLRWNEETRVWEVAEFKAVMLHGHPCIQLNGQAMTSQECEHAVSVLNEYCQFNLTELKPAEK